MTISPRLNRACTRRPRAPIFSASPTGGGARGGGWSGPGRWAAYAADDREPMTRSCLSAADLRRRGRRRTSERGVPPRRSPRPPRGPPPGPPPGPPRRRDRGGLGGHLACPRGRYHRRGGAVAAATLAALAAAAAPRTDRPRRRPADAGHRLPGRPPGFGRVGRHRGRGMVDGRGQALTRGERVVGHARGAAAASGRLMRRRPAVAADRRTVDPGDRAGRGPGAAPGARRGGLLRLGGRDFYAAGLASPPYPPGTSVG